mgnify:CR=1 FL=1|tara:strand:+ start:260 stop:649 length:390 start_codon:yes stop_codon:yes gene_type:complete
MEIKGKIIKLLPLQTGTSARGEWRKQEFIIETQGQYPKQVCLYMWGDAIDNSKLQEGRDVTASIEIESREYNGKYYTNVKAWRLEPLVQAAAQAPVPQMNAQDGPPPAAPFSEPKLADLSGTEDDDLPF